MSAALEALNEKLRLLQSVAATAISHMRMYQERAETADKDARDAKLAIAQIEAAIHVLEVQSPKPAKKVPKGPPRRFGR